MGGRGTVPLERAQLEQSGDWPPYVGQGQHVRESGRVWVWGRGGGEEGELGWLGKGGRAFCSGNSRSKGIEAGQSLGGGRGGLQG